MTAKATKVRAGAFVVTTLALLALVLVVFGGFRFWEDQARYRVVFPDSVMGLDEGAYVYLEGIRVGRVDAIALAPGGGVAVEIVVKRETPVRADSRARLQFAGITGLKVIDLEAGTATAALLPDGATIPAGEGVLDKLQKRAETLADQSTQLMERANRIVENVVTLTDPAQFADLAEILRNTKALTGHLAATSATLNGVIAENRSAIRTSIAALDGFIARLDQLVRANEGPLRSAMFDLRQASRNFKELSRDVRQRPSRLLFSKAPGDRKLP